jgi:tetratricopeptide (TPR) repeat protein
MNRSLALYWLGRLDEAVTGSLDGLKAARAALDVSWMMSTLPQLGTALAGSGRYDEAARAFDEARRLGREHGVEGLLARAIAMSAGFHLDLGDFERAEAISQEARELALSCNVPPPATSAGLDLFVNFVRREDVGRAEKLVDEVAVVAEKASGFHRWLWRIRLAESRAEIALARGDWDEAVRWASDAINQSHARRRAKYHAIGLDTRARALAAQGRTKAALVDLRSAVELARTMGDPALLLRVAATLLPIEGDLALAADAAAAIKRISTALPDAEMRRRFAAADAVRILAKHSGPFEAPS